MHKRTFSAVCLFLMYMSYMYFSSVHLFVCFSFGIFLDFYSGATVFLYVSYFID